MDYYTTLGVAKNATPDEIKKAYRRLASQHHPDKGGDTTKFQQIQSAYDTLSDPQKRQQYDNPQPQFNQNGFHFNFGNNMDDFFGAFGLHDILKQQANQKRNQLLRTRVEVSLMDSYNGSTKTLNIQTQNGNHVLNINIPKGIQTGQQIKYENVIPNATIIIEFIVMPDLRFERNQNDLYSNYQISVLDLILGTKFDFHTIGGKTVEVLVKPMTQPYMQLKLNGCGMPILNTNSYGDQIILIKPYIPANIDSEVLEVLTKHRNLEKEHK